MLPPPMLIGLIYPLSCYCFGENENKTITRLSGLVSVQITKSLCAPPHSIPVCCKRFTCTTILNRFPVTPDFSSPFVCLSFNPCILIRLKERETCLCFQSWAGVKTTSVLWGFSSFRRCEWSQWPEEWPRGQRGVSVVTPTPSSCSMTKGCLTAWSCSCCLRPQGRDVRTLSSVSGKRIQHTRCWDVKHDMDGLWDNGLRAQTGKRSKPLLYKTKTHRLKESHCGTFASLFIHFASHFSCLASSPGCFVSPCGNYV